MMSIALPTGLTSLGESHISQFCLSATRIQEPSLGAS